MDYRSADGKYLSTLANPVGARGPNVLAMSFLGTLWPCKVWSTDDWALGSQQLLFLTHGLSLDIFQSDHLLS